MGQNLIFVPYCHSTNSLALELMKDKGLHEGSVVITGDQRAGRGQRGNTWQTEPGKNLTFSIILQPTFLSAPDQFYITIALSLGVADYLKSMGIETTSIKWPNDLVVAGIKISGMLIENIVNGNLIQSTVAGIGININQTEFPSLRATSLRNVLSRDFDLNEELNALLCCIEPRYLLLRNHYREGLMKDYHESLYGMGESRTFKAGDKEFTGVIQGIAQNGKLKVSKNDGSSHVFDFKEISFL